MATFDTPMQTTTRTKNFNVNDERIEGGISEPVAKQGSPKSAPADVKRGLSGSMNGSFNIS
eukprot:5531590-Prymnesium_polylepis.1